MAICYHYWFGVVMVVHQILQLIISLCTRFGWTTQALTNLKPSGPMMTRNKSVHLAWSEMRQSTLSL